MTTELRCECNDEWKVIPPEGTRYQSTQPIKCPVCQYWMWYDAYTEDML